MTFNTSLAINQTFILKVGSLHGQIPVEIPIQLNIVSIAKIDFNAKPYLVDPPLQGVNLVVEKSKKGGAWQTVMKVSSIFDDRNEPAFINFTSDTLGFLSYKFDGLVARQHENKTEYMTYYPSTTELVVMIPTFD